jgi:hypothetical protein
MSEEFYGKVIVGVDGLDNGSDSVTITFEDGSSFHMWHSQDCCESVSIEDIDSSCSLEGAVWFECEVSSKDRNSEYGDVEEWTFYTIRTDKGYAWIRWYGTSNGYSTSVSTKYCAPGEDRGYW